MLDFTTGVNPFGALDVVSILIYYVRVSAQDATISL